jgi:hypothetical protein
MAINSSVQKSKALLVIAAILAAGTAQAGTIVSLISSSGTILTGQISADSGFTVATSVSWFKAAGSSGGVTVSDPNGNGYTNPGSPGTWTFDFSQHGNGNYHLVLSVQGCPDLDLYYTYNGKVVPTDSNYQPLGPSTQPVNGNGGSCIIWPPAPATSAPFTSARSASPPALPR